MQKSISVVATIRKVLLPIAAIFLLSRAALLAVAALTAIHIAPELQVHGTSWLSRLCRWDCGWYLGIARGGYSTVESADQLGATNYGFYPLFPLLTRAVALAFNCDAFYAAVALSNLCFFLSLVYVYRYALLLNLDRTVALLAVALLCIMPQSIVFSATYSESLFLLLLVVAMFYLRRERFLTAGIAAALLSATRANGIFFIVFALAWIIRRDGLRTLLTPWHAPETFVPIVLAPLGLFLFWGYCFITTGDAFAFASTELAGWGWHFSPPWQNLSAMLRSDGIVYLASLVSVSIFASSCLLLRQQLYEEFILCTALILLVWSGDVAGSIFRYWLVLFPIWIAVARVLAVRPVASAMTFSLLALFNGLMMCAWTLGKLIAI